MSYLKKTKNFLEKFEGFSKANEASQYADKFGTIDIF